MSSRRRKQPLAKLPIIKVVGDFCNLRCKYCFYHGRVQSAPTIMSESLLVRFLSQYASLFEGQKACFIWHGGEPLLAGIEFFQKVVSSQDKLFGNSQVDNRIQTNATLITDEWASFFAQTGFKVGVSLDGDILTHNRFRKKANGAGSFRQAIDGVKRLRRHGIVSGVIATMTKSSTPEIERILDFFANELGLKAWSFNLFRCEQGEMAAESLGDHEVIEIIKKSVDFWMRRDDPEMSVREVDNFLAGIFGYRSRSCSFNGSCGHYFCLDWNGDIYPCDRFSGDKTYFLGNLVHGDLGAILSGKKMRKHIKKIASLPDCCTKCEWKVVCNNGCGAMRDKSSLYYFCQARQDIFSTIQKRVTHLKPKKGGDKHGNPLTWVQKSPGETGT